MINTGFHLIYKPQWQAQHDPDLAWHCDLMKRESLEEDCEGKNKAFCIESETSWLIYIFWFLNFDHRGSVYGS